VRVTDDGCRRDEDRLAWNRVGPTGPAGPAGPAGADGKDGADGADAVVEIYEVPGASFGQTVVEGSRQFAGMPVTIDTIAGQRGTFSVSSSFSGTGGATVIADACYRRAGDPTADVLPLVFEAGEQAATVDDGKHVSLSVHKTWVVEETGSYLIGMCVRRADTPGDIYIGGTRGFITITS
jgi:hypothetical protein